MNSVLMHPTAENCNTDFGLMIENYFTFIVITALNRDFQGTSFVNFIN